MIKIIKIILLSLSLITLLNTIALLIFGVLVSYQDNSGTDLIIYLGKNRLLSEGKKFDVNYVEGAYTTYNFGDGLAPPKPIGMSLAYYKIIGSEPTEMGIKQKAPVLEIKSFYSIYFIVFISVLSIVYIIWWSFKVKNGHVSD